MINRENARNTALLTLASLLVLVTAFVVFVVLTSQSSAAPNGSTEGDDSHENASVSAPATDTEVASNSAGDEDEPIQEAESPEEDVSEDASEDDIPVEVTMESEQLPARLEESLVSQLEALGLESERVELVTYRSVDPNSRSAVVEEISVIDGALIDSSTGNLVTFTIGQHEDSLPLDEIPLIELYTTVDVPGAEAVAYINEESATFVVVRGGGGPLIVATVAANQPGEGDALAREAVALLQGDILSVLLQQESED